MRTKAKPNRSQIGLWGAWWTMECIAASAHAAGSSAAFLKIPIHPQALAMGSGHVASAAGVSSLGHNPAGLAGLRPQEVGFLYTPHLQDTHLGFLAYARPIPIGMIGLDYLTVRAETLDGRDETGAAVGGFGTEDRAVALTLDRAFAASRRRPDGRLRLGASIKHISSRIASYGTSTFAADAGVQFAFAVVPVTAGLAVRNLGSGLRLLGSEEPLPLSVAAGLAVKLPGAVSLACGLARYPREDKTEASVGTRVEIPGGVYLQGHFGAVRQARAASPGAAVLAGGIGFRRGRYEFSYAFSPAGELGNTQRMGITLRLGSSTQARQRKAPAKRVPVGWNCWRGSGSESSFQGPY